MTLHEHLKAILTAAVPAGTAVHEIFAPFEAKSAAFRLTTPCAIFRVEEMVDKGWGTSALTVRVDILGTPAGVEAISKAIRAAFGSQQNSEDWSLSLASGTLREVWDTDLKTDWGTMTLKGVAIEKEQI